MKRLDLVDRLREEWHRERPELDTSGMGVVGRAILLGELMKKRAEAVLEPFGIGYTDLDVLATLRRSGPPHELRPAVLLETILIQSGSLTACLNRLEASGLVVREPTPKDRRGLSVRLTTDGRRLVDRAIEARFTQAVEAVAPLTAEERRQLESLLRRLLLIEMDAT
jgi:DNA-binding MarR family transcriptional regulator